MRQDSKAIRFELNQDENGYFIQYPNNLKKSFQRSYFMAYLSECNWDRWEYFTTSLINYKSAELVWND